MIDPSKKSPDMLALDIVAGPPKHSAAPIDDAPDDAPAGEDAADKPAKSPDAVLDSIQSELERLRAMLRA